MIRLALRNLLSRKRRTLLTALAVVVGVAQISGAFVLTDSMNSEVDKLFQTGQKGVEVIVAPKTASDDVDPPVLPGSMLKTVQGVDGVRQAVGQIFTITSILKPDGKPVSSGPPSFIASQNPPEFSSWKITSGRWATASDETVLDRSTATRVGYKVGDRVTIVGAKGAERLKITGLATFGDSSLAGASVAITTGENAARISGRTDGYDSIAVDAESGVKDQTLRDSIAGELKGQPVTVRTAKEEAAKQASDLKDQLGFLQPVLLAFGLIALFVGSFVIVNTFSATLAQRSQELALLRALGATRGQVTRSVLVESALIGTIAGVLGLIGGLLLAPGILALFKSFGADLPNGGTVIQARTVIVALLVGPIVTTLAGLLPVRRAAKVPPVQAMRGDTSREESTRPGSFAYLLGALAAFGVVGALVFKGTLAAICLGLGAVLTLIAVAALAPLVLEPVLRVVGAPIAQFGTMGRLARLNAMRQPRRTTTTAGALMVGVALVTFVSVFAAGVSAIAKDAFSDRVRADLGLSDSGNFGFPVAANDVVAADPDVKRVVGLSYSGFEDVRSGKTVSFTGVDPGLADVYRLKWVDGNDALLDQLGPRDVISDVSAGSDRPEIQNARVGDRITVKTASGQQFTVTVRGTVDEGSTLLGGSLITSRAALDAGASQPRVQLSLVRLKPGADQITVQRRLSKALKEKFPIVDALTRKELEKQFVGQINQLVSMIYAFLFFALLVSLLGISTTFTLTVQERRRELGMMRAIGTTRRQIRRLVRFEAILTGLLGGVLGVTVGLGFGALVARLLDGFSYVVPVGSIIVVLIVAAVVAALAATLPARRAGKIDIVQAVTVE